MYKKDMTEQQLRDKDAFYRTVGEAGWSLGGWDRMLENGLDVSPEARAEFTNDAAQLALEYQARDRYIVLLMESDQEAEPMAFRFYYSDHLPDLLNAILRDQDVLSPKNYTDTIKTVIPFTESAFFQVGEDQLVKLSLDK